MFPLAIPMALGAVGGALTNKNDPLKGVLMGAGLGAATGGLGGLGATAAAPGAAGGLGLSAGASGLGLQAPGALGASLAEMGGAQGLTAAAGGGTALTAASAAAPAATGLLSKGGLQSMTDMAGLASKAGVFDSPQGPAAQSAGIPGRAADFTGLLSAGRSNQLSGAEKLMAQRNARRG